MNDQFYFSLIKLLDMTFSSFRLRSRKAQAMLLSQVLLQIKEPSARKRTERTNVKLILLRDMASRVE